jgi:hypothetical protein
MLRLWNGEVNTKLTKVVKADLRRIRRRWRKHKKLFPEASALSFVAQIVRTGMIPGIPRKVA